MQETHRVKFEVVRLREKEQGDTWRSCIRPLCCSSAVEKAVCALSWTAAVFFGQELGRNTLTAGHPPCWVPFYPDDGTTHRGKRGKLVQYVSQEEI